MFRLTIPLRCLAIALVFLLVFVLAACQSAPERGVRPDDSLTNTYWKLMSVNGNVVRLSEDQREPSMVLVAEGNRVRGFAGCNRLSGRYTSDGDTLRFAQIATTRKFCVHIMPGEQAFLHALSHTAQARIDGNRLSLLDESGQTLARFESRLMQ